MTYIREHEQLDRGWYGAPVGWMDSNRNGEFAVAIRSGLVQGNIVSLFAGCGVVRDSDPEAEYEETKINSDRCCPYWRTDHESYRKIDTVYSKLVDELVAAGVTDAVISPGSRSTPMAMTMTEHPDLKQWVIIDERSAAFFALGMAKQTKRPVAIVCTSGTAAANYFPAIVEAHYSRVPLIVLTADRPHELRDVGAPQSIGQLELYGDYPKWFHEMALPEAGEDMLGYVRNKASRAVQTAAQGNAGPVHLNFPFREPLIPDFSLEDLWGDREGGPYRARTEGKRRLDSQQLEQISKKLASSGKGLIICGPQTDPDLTEALAVLAREWEVPVLADPLSQLRAGSHPKDYMIEGYDAFCGVRQSGNS